MHPPSLCTALIWQPIVQCDCEAYNSGETVADLHDGEGYSPRNDGESAAKREGSFCGYVSQAEASVCDK